MAAQLIDRVYSPVKLVEPGRGGALAEVEAAHAAANLAGFW